MPIQDQGSRGSWATESDVKEKKYIEVNAKKKNVKTKLNVELKETKQVRYLELEGKL